MIPEARRRDFLDTLKLVPHAPDMVLRVYVALVCEEMRVPRNGQREAEIRAEFEELMSNGS